MAEVVETDFLNITSMRVHIQIGVETNTDIVVVSAADVELY